MNMEIMTHEPAEVKLEATERLRRLLGDYEYLETNLLRPETLRELNQWLNEIRQEIQTKQAADAEEREHFINALRHIANHAYSVVAVETARKALEEAGVSLK